MILPSIAITYTKQNHTSSKGSKTGKASKAQQSTLCTL
jgi:hypothetical protein